MRWVYHEGRQSKCQCYWWVGGGRLQVSELGNRGEAPKPNLPALGNDDDDEHDEHRRHHHHYHLPPTYLSLLLPIFLGRSVPRAELVLYEPATTATFEHTILSEDLDPERRERDGGA